ncbi:hypothetical protein EDF60_0348 [Leucobacter luti]|nr:hypothetical protein [Leucobacter luti]TCK45123.1 hypothetical protein EDF60_0348 [Leucobacter luti]
MGLRWVLPRAGSTHVGPMSVSAASTPKMPTCGRRVQGAPATHGAREVRAGYASYPRATPAQCETVEADPETNVTSQDRPQLIE